MLKVRYLSVASLFAVSTMFALPSQALTNVSVTLRISTTNYNLKDVSCAVSVLPGSDGVQVLQAAATSGCIKSYALATFGIGHYLDCVDDGIHGNRCGDPAPTYLRYWAMRENCVYTDYGVDDFRAAQGDELSFTFEPWVTFAAGPATGIRVGPLCT